MNRVGATRPLSSSGGASPSIGRGVLRGMGCAVLAVAVSILGGPSRLSGQSQLNENCVVSILNRTAQVRADGSWDLPNIPAGFGPVRARATCVENGITRSGQSDFFTIVAGRMNAIPPIVLGPTTPIPQSLAVTAPVTTLTTIGQTAQLAVIATYAGGGTQDVTAPNTGTTYLSTNPAILAVNANGLVTAARSGTVLVRASNEGTPGLLQMRVTLGGDSDGDGIPDDIELAEGLNPNDPTDALEDFDRDGLSNREEIALGTNLRVADTDGDGILDGEEVVLGADGYITNPLLADTDGDGVRDGLEVATGSDPTNPASVNLAKAASRIELTPPTFNLTVNSIIGESSRQLTVTGYLVDGTTINLTSTLRGTNYTSSDLSVCNFGSPDGRVFAGTPGSCTITATNSGHSSQSQGTVTSFTPTALSFVAIPGFANNVDISGDFAYVAAGATGLQVVSIANRSAPAVVAALDTPGNANDVKIVGNFAYVADGVSGLQIINVANPMAPVLAGSYNTPGDAWDVVVRDDRAFVADGANGLVIIDVSTPSAPSLLGAIDPAGIQKGVDVDPVRQLAVLASGTSGLHVVNVANPVAPVLIGSLAGGDVRDVALAQDHVMLADYSRSFTSVDLGDPTAPVLRNSTAQNLGGRLHDVVVQGSFGLGADVLFVNGVPIVNIDNLANPIPRAILNFSSFRDDDGQGIAADGAYVYLAAVLGSAFTENGASGNSRLYIGQYLALEDRNGIAPTVALTSPADGSSFIEGANIPLRATATDDVAVTAVSFLVNGQVVFTDTSAPYEFQLPAPSNTSSLTIGARAFDLGGNVGTSPTVSVSILPDPLTTVVGRAIDAQGSPLANAVVEVLGFKTTTAGNGTFSIAAVPTIRGNLTVIVTTEINNLPASGRSAATPPVPGGTTDVGDIVVREQASVSVLPADPQSLFVSNCIPFGNNTSFGFTGFIYRNVPAFELRVGDRFAFDLGALNGQDIRRNIYFAVANQNPQPGGAPQGIRALAWTQIVADTQTPENARGDLIKGNYELRYRAEAPFSFPGGGFIIGFGGSPPGAYADPGCEQVLVGTTSSDPSGFFHRRFYFQQDQTLSPLDVGNSDGSSIGGVIIRPPQ